MSLRLAWVYDMAEVGIFVAQDAGFYAEEGLDLDVKPGGFGLDPFKMVAAGSDTFGVGGAVNLLLARQKELPVVAVAAEFQETPVGFIVRTNSGIDGFTDFIGKRVGVQTGTDTDTLYRALLHHHAMRAEEIQEVAIQYDPTPFVAGRIDVLPGYVSNQPITLANQGIPVRVITARESGFDIYGNVYFVTESTLRERPSIVAAFLRATYRGWERALASPETAVAAMQQRSKDFGEADLRAIHAAVQPFIRPPGTSDALMRMSPGKWQRTADVLSAAGLTEPTDDWADAFAVVDWNLKTNHAD
ncbi:MAG: ABC transporter substrate-binding protein [Opitutales bacterium]